MFPYKINVHIYISLLAKIFQHSCNSVILYHSVRTTECHMLRLVSHECRSSEHVRKHSETLRGHSYRSQEVRRNLSCAEVNTSRKVLSDMANAMIHSFMEKKMSSVVIHQNDVFLSAFYFLFSITSPLYEIYVTSISGSVTLSAHSSVAELRWNKCDALRCNRYQYIPSHDSAGLHSNWMFNSVSGYHFLKFCRSTLIRAVTSRFATSTRFACR
jgi:hypothetical protein